MIEALILWYVEETYYTILIWLGAVGAVLLLTLSYVIWRYANTLED